MAINFPTSPSVNQSYTDTATNKSWIWNGTAWATLNSAPSSVGGIYINNSLVSTSYTIPTGQNGFSVGPITISNGTAITVSSGQRWVIL
jgi:hypothetical protein